MKSKRTSLFRSMIIISLLVMIFGCTSKGTKSNPDQSRANDIIEKTAMEEKEISKWLRVSSFIYFDPANKLVDITDSKQMMFYEGAVFGWSIPLVEGHPSFSIKEVRAWRCEDGTNHEVTEDWVVPSTSTHIQKYLELEATDCRGNYLYSIYINQIPIKRYQLRIW